MYFDHGRDVVALREAVEGLVTGDPELAPYAVLGSDSLELHLPEPLDWHAIKPLADDPDSPGALDQLLAED